MLLGMSGGGLQSSIKLGERLFGLSTNVTLTCRWVSPAMNQKEATDVGRARYLGIVTGLLDIGSIEFDGETVILKGGILFNREFKAHTDLFEDVLSKFGIRTQEDKVIDLA